MKNQYIKDLKEKDHVTDSFLVTKKDTGVSKSGKPYLILRLRDSTGEVEARVWENAEALDRAFEQDNVVTVRGFAVSYQGRLQVNVSEVSRLPEEKYSLRDYLPASERDPEDMMAELERIVAGMKDVHIRSLLQALFGDPEIRSRFMIAPAAKAMHHPYLSGLLEHVISICGLVDKVAGHYGPGINRDLLTAGAILHDIGKIYELKYSRAFDYTDEGRLIGHITIGIEMIDRKLAGLPDFPKELAVLIKHMILSHHGQLEFGSPKRPKIPEALILTYLDDMDAKINAVRTVMEEEKGSDSNWTSYQRIFERAIYKGNRFIADEASTGAADTESEAARDARKVEKGGEKKEYAGKGEAPEPDLFSR